MSPMRPDAKRPALIFRSHEHGPADDLARVDAGLDAHNRTFAPLADVRPLSTFAHAGDRLVGGAVGRTWGACAELQQLWVEPAQRREGIGARLLEAFEAEAARRGCTLVYLETFDFQAPAFYRARGYQVDVETHGFTGGAVKYAMRKRLG